MLLVYAKQEQPVFMTTIFTRHVTYKNTTIKKKTVYKCMLYQMQEYSTLDTTQNNDGYYGQFLISFNDLTEM